MRSRFRTAAAAYRRGGPIREPYDVVLIICEGAKTEPNYIRNLRVQYRLSSVNVRVLPPPRSDPLSIAKFAIEQLTADRELDTAYCVFDRDLHANYADALLLIQVSRFGREGRLIAIPSVPCFEIWLLLHYRYSAAGYAASGELSACDCVIRDLRQHLPKYAKGSAQVFDDLMPQLQRAITHAERLEAHNNDTGSDNPSTRMHHLVKYLTELRSS